MNELQIFESAEFGKVRIIEIDDLSPLEYSEINRIFKSNSIL